MNDKEFIESSDNLIENSPISIHFIDANGTILWANQKELSAMGYTAEEFFDKNIVDFHEDKLAILDVLNKAADFNGVETYPVRLVHKDKTTLYALITSNAYKEDGEFKHTRSYTNFISKEAYELFRQELVEKNNHKKQS